MSINAMKQALEALETCKVYDEADAWFDIDKVGDASDALRLAIEQAERQEPVAWMADNGTLINACTDPHLFTPLYTAPPQRQPDYVWCGCGDGIMPNTGAKCGTCARGVGND